MKNPRNRENRKIHAFQAGERKYVFGLSGNEVTVLCTRNGSKSRLDGEGAESIVIPVEDLFDFMEAVIHVAAKVESGSKGAWKGRAGNV